MSSTRKREPSLADLRDWCEDRANDFAEDPQDRSMWQQLADEYTARLGDRTDHHDEPLF